MSVNSSTVGKIFSLLRAPLSSNPKDKDPRREDKRFSEATDLTVEWAQPSTKTAEDGSQYTPVLFDTLLVKPEDVNVIKLYSNGRVLIDGPDKDVDLSYGLEQIEAKEYMWGSFDQPFWNMQPFYDGRLFNTSGVQEEAELLQFVLSRTANRNVNISKEVREHSFEKSGSGYVVHVDDAKVKFWFDTQRLLAFGASDPSGKLDSVLESLAYSVASDPTIDFANPTDKCLKKINHAIRSFLGILQVAYGEEDISNTLDAVFSIGKKRKMAVAFNPRCPADFYDDAEHVVIPRSGCVSRASKEEDKRIYSEFAPVVIAHPSRTRHKETQSVRYREPSMPSFLTRKK